MSVNIYDASRGKLIRMAPLFKPDIPDGKTVEPANDVQILLKCAGIKDKDYTTISQVISDTTSFDKIIDTNNSVDYLVRSTDWASSICSDSASMAYIAQSQYAAEQLLDNSTWYSGILNSSYRDVQFLLKTSGIFDKDYTTISQVLSDTTSLSTVINSTRGIDYLVRTTAWASSVATNSNAMTYIGQNNYASNTLLDTNTTWRTALFNSSYMTKVFNVVTPQMTSNRTPSGGANANNNASDAWKAFNSAYVWYGPESSSDYSTWISYAFPAEKKLYGATFTLYAVQKAYNYRFDTLTNGTYTTRVSSSSSSATVKNLFTSPVTAIAGRMYVDRTVDTSGGKKCIAVKTFQLYGRQDV